MKSRIEEVKAWALASVAAADGTQALSDVRVRFLGKNGEMTALMKLLGTVSKEERPEMG